MAQVRGRLPGGLIEIRLLDVHVVRVEVNGYVRLANYLLRPDRLVTGVHKKGFITVYGFDTDGHAQSFGITCGLPERTCGPLPVLFARHSGDPAADRGIGHTGEHGGAHVRGRPDAREQVLDAPPAGGLVVASGVVSFRAGR